MPVREKGLKLAIWGGGKAKPPPTRGYGAENRFAMALQWVCGGMGRLCAE